MIIFAFKSAPCDQENKGFYGWVCAKNVVAFERWPLLFIFILFLKGRSHFARVPKIKGKGQVSFPLVLRFGHEPRLCVDPGKGFKTFFSAGSFRNNPHFVYFIVINP